jgi:fructokinase
MSFRVIGIGEVLWDLLPTGAQLGGAPANFACHAQALGARAGVISRVGLDQLGQDIRLRFEQNGFPMELIQLDENSPTGTVSVELDKNGIPRFTIRVQVAWDHIQATAAALSAVQEADAVCFGSLALRSECSRKSIYRLVSETPPSALRIFDVNLRQDFYSREVIQRSLSLANVLKLNNTELALLAPMFGLAGSTEDQIAGLARQFDLQVVALTSGPHGSLLYKAGRWSECAVRPIRVKDTVGAGDAFTAALAMGLLQRMDLEGINAAANEIARYVCSCAGATPPLPDPLRRLFSRRPPNLPQAGPTVARI